MPSSPVAPAAPEPPASPGAAATPTPPENRASGRIRARVPSTRVLQAINPFVSAVLRSPFHRVLSKHVLLLTYTGRMSGRTYTIPVGYMREGNTFTIVSVHRWWKNLHGGAPVAVLLEGRHCTGRADVIEQREAVLAEVDRLMARYGRKRAGQQIGIALDTTPPPSREEVAEAMRGRVVIRLCLDDGTDRAGA